MRSEEDIQADLDEIQRQKAALDEESARLKLERQKVRLLAKKAEVLETIGPLASQVRDGEWAPPWTVCSHYNPYHGYAICVPPKELRREHRHNRQSLWAYLCLWDDNKWSLTFSFDKYGFSERRAKLFTGSEDEAKAWATQEILDKLKKTKIKLSKDLA